MKDKTKEILDKLNNSAEHYILYDYEAKILLDYITNLQEENQRLKELCDKYEEEHSTAFKLWTMKMEEIPTYEEKKELQNRIDKAIEYIEYQISQLDFEKDTKAKMLGAMVLVFLQGSDE